MRDKTIAIAKNTDRGYLQISGLESHEFLNADIDPEGSPENSPGAAPVPPHERVALPSPLNTASASYYTNKDGANTVNCTVQFAFPANSTLAGGLSSYTLPPQSLTSVRPSGLFQIATGAVGWLNGGTSVFGLLGNASVAEGQNWSKGSITVGGGFPQAGKGSFIQLITASRYIDRQTNTNYPSEFVNVWYGVPCLDTGVPYPYGAIWTVSGLGSGSDSPQQATSIDPGDNGGSNWYYASATDTMTTWMMYQPPNVGSMSTVLIPIAKYTWGWSDSASLTGTPLAWLLGTGSAPNVTSSQLATDHPIWSNFLPSPFSFIAGTH